MPYYGFYIPPQDSEAFSSNNGANTTNSNNKDGSANYIYENAENSPLVFENKRDALKFLKLHKDARFKEFLAEEDAIKYAQTGFEIVKTKYNDGKKFADSADLERAKFTAPTSQQLMTFRGFVESDFWENVKTLVWKNPRYLVSYGDTPTILKEGYRYNAMHFCALNNSHNVAQLILDTILDREFAELLIGKKNEKSCQQLCSTLLDYYLNLPEKGRNETPLHFASKYGTLRVAKVLLSYPQCKHLRNSQGSLPQDIICQRNKQNLQEMNELFRRNYYVPVLRSNDNAVPAQIGEPFKGTNPPVNKNQPYDPLAPDVQIVALAGPMEETTAKHFFRRWKTPPRMRNNISSPIANNSSLSQLNSLNSTPIKTSQNSNTNFTTPTANFKRRTLFNSTPNRSDPNDIANYSNIFSDATNDDSIHIKQNGTVEKERIYSENKDMPEANNNKFEKNFPKRCTPWFKLKSKAFSVYRNQNNASPIVDSIDRNDELNDSLLNISELYDELSFQERHLKNSDLEKGIECVGRVLANQNRIDWREYWDFLGEFIDIASENGIKKLENYLEKRRMEEEKTVFTQKPDIIDDVCHALENVFRNSNTTTDRTTLNKSTTQSTTPYTYVEKSLQVHAKRMTKTIIHNINNEDSIMDALLLELRRVKSLIYSFKEDSGFINVNFQKVHSRIGNLISLFLENTQEVSKQTKWKVLLILQNFTGYVGEKREHMECVCSRIVEMLQHPTEQIPPEDVKTEEICFKIWCQENDCDCQWENISRRKANRCNRMMANNHRNHQHFQNFKQDENLKKDSNNQPNISNEEPNTTQDVAQTCSDDDEFWSDFGSSDGEDDVFITPSTSPTYLSFIDDKDDKKGMFIYGNEPTKRDIDVLNAILSVDTSKYPNVHSWKAALMRYTNEERDFFLSPRTVQKSISFVHPQTPTSFRKTDSLVRSNASFSSVDSRNSQSSLVTIQAPVLPPNVGLIKQPILQYPKGRTLFPSTQWMMTAISLENNSNSNDTSNANINTTKAPIIKDNMNDTKKEFAELHSLSLKESGYFDIHPPAKEELVYENIFEDFC